ncbi:MAG: hypothetical protein PVJ07_05525 [Anaerolineales bacterium]|jgi:hypothetical protein
MGRNPLIASLLSLIVPGLGQMYAGEKDRGAAILVAAIVIGNLNILLLPILFQANPGTESVWAYWIPRIGHDILSIWSIAFWVWAIIDAHICSRGLGQKR